MKTGEDEVEVSGTKGHGFKSVRNGLKKLFSLKFTSIIFLFVLVRSWKNLQIGENRIECSKYDATFSTGWKL